MLTPENIAAIDAFIAAYATDGAKAAARVAGISVLSAYNLASQLRGVGVNIPSEHGKMDKRVAFDMRKAGVSDRQIAKHFGVTPPSVSHALGPRKKPMSAKEFLASQ